MTAERLRRTADAAALAASLVLAAALCAVPASAPVLGIAALAGLVAWIAWQDALSFTIPDGAVAGLALVGIGLRLVEGEAALHGPAETLLALALDGALCGGSLLALREAFYRRRGYDGLGFGDVKLAAAGGLLVGTGGFSWALCGASLGAIAAVLAKAAVRRSMQGGDRLAFGAFLAPALLAVWAMQQIDPVLAWGAP